MRLLWVKPGGLWPANTGGRLRSLNMIDALSRSHRITLVTTHAPSESVEALRKRLPYCERIESIPHVAPKINSLRFIAALTRSWLSRLPVDIQRHAVPELRHRVEHLMANDGTDLCVADFLCAMPNVPTNGRVPVVLFEHNVEFMIWRRMGAVEWRPWRRALLEIEWRKMRRFEANACRDACLTIAVSPTDRKVLLRNAPEAKVIEIPTGVDVDYFSPVNSPETPSHLVFTGSMDWYPNEDGILHFINDILPLIREQVPRVSLTIVGRNPGPRLTRHALAAGVGVTGTVDDIRPYLGKASVCVVPLRIGGGTRLKIFEALAMGKAVVSTTIGAEGLPLTSGRHYLAADGPEAFAAAVVSLLHNPARRAFLGQEGRRLMMERYSWVKVARQFGKYCKQAVT
jgi:polysaccharide biosynthesis protein PslH